MSIIRHYSKSKKIRARFFTFYKQAKHYYKAAF